jgi:hypothetical protein
VRGVLKEAFALPLLEVKWRLKVQAKITEEFNEDSKV